MSIAGTTTDFILVSSYTITTKDRTTPMLMAIHQPNFCPRLKVLTKIAQAGSWIILDNVQFVRNDYQHRFLYHPSATSDRTKWLTVPVHLKNGRATLIRDVEIVQPARSMRLVDDSVRHAYGRSPDRSLILDYFDSIRGYGLTGSLAEYSAASMAAAFDLIGLSPTVHRIEQLGAAGWTTNPTARLAKLTLAAGGSAYLSGSGGRTYLDIEQFAARQVQLRWQELGPMTASPEVRNIGFIDAIARKGVTTVRRTIAEDWHHSAGFTEG